MARRIGGFGARSGGAEVGQNADRVWLHGRARPFRETSRIPLWVVMLDTVELLL